MSVSSLRASRAKRVSRLPNEQKHSNVAKTVVLATALSGLVGFAIHGVWITSILVLAVGLGYVVADSRLDRIAGVNRRHDGHPHGRARTGSCPQPDTLPPTIRSGRSQPDSRLADSSIRSG
jgi:preprotein translocase subunit Sss1